MTHKKATDYAHSPPEEVRNIIRNGKWTLPTSGMCRGYAQANLLALPRDWAFDFLLFATRNQAACPLLEATDPGEKEPKITTPGANLATDLPKYIIWENGKITSQPTDATPYWREDLVAFLIGCSFTFETPMIDCGVPIRHIDQNRNVPMYVTDIPCLPAGRLSGNMVVSMRPVHGRLASKAVMSSGRFPAVHGAPIHIGDPSAIGIKDLNTPDFGDPVDIYQGEIPLFWPCGVTPQSVIMASKPPFAITHAPGHMFITSLKDKDIAVFP